MGRVSWILLGCLTLLPAAHARAASFDCSKAATDVEKMICGDEKLSQLDSDMATAYKETLAAGADKGELLRLQRRWIQFPRDSCPDVTCLTRVYTGRLKALKITQSALAGLDRTAPDAKVRAFLLTYSPDEPLKYSTATASLDGGTTMETFIYLSGGCGSGGCDMYLLRPSGDGFEVIDYFTVSNLPVYVLPSKTKGWNDIAIIVRSGTAVLKFDGRKYPSNPSMAPKMAVDPNQPGVVQLPLHY